LAEGIRVEKLACGVTVLLRELHLAPLAEVQIWAGVGSADEGPGEAGLAHFHEHMLFKGTETRAVGEIAGAVEGAGGRINAFTSFDATCYHATLPSDSVALGLDALADAVQHSVFDPAEVAREVEVVLEEIRRSEDDPQHVLGDALFSTVFAVHPYRAPVLGTSASVAQFDAPKLRRFYRRWYAAENLVVCAAGDFDPADFLARVEAAFAKAKPGAPRRARPAEPPQREPRLRLLERDFERAGLELCWPAVPFRHPDAPLLDLLAFVLGQGESSRLDRRVKEEQGLADRIDASCYTPLDPGVFGIGADLDAERAPALVEALLREVECLRREPVGEEELEKARRNFLAAKAWEQESVAGLARKLGSAYLLTGDPSFEDAYLARVRAASAGELLRAAREWLPPERLCLALVAPKGEAPRESELREALARGHESAARRFAAPLRAPTAAAAQAYRLANGVRLLVQPRREIPVVSARAVLLGGQLVESEETAGLGSFLSSLWLRGSEAHAAADFARRVESLAADVDGFSGRSSTGLTLDAPSESFAAVLELFAEALLSPAFADEEIERERRETLAALARREDRLGARAFDLFTRAHWERHPYRLPLPGTPETVARFAREDLVRHQQQLVRAGNLVLAVVGDVDPDETAVRVGRLFGELAGGGAAVEALLPPLEPAPREPRSAVERKERAQAHLVIGFRGLDVHDPERHALEVLCQILSGQGGRLFLELRDKKSLAYSVSATNVEGVAPGFFASYIATAPEKLDEARSGMLDELRRAQDAPPGAAELERARRALLGSFAIDRQRAAARALQLALDTRYGLAGDFDTEYPERIRAVSAEDVLRIARRVIDLGAYTIAEIRP
jgi:zinc protease